jgi:thioredoxin-like negative regulator of GroEL
MAEMSRSIFELGDSAEAERNWRESLRLAIETQGTFIEVEALVGLANLQAQRGDREYALELLLIVLHHSTSLQDTKSRASDLLAVLSTADEPAGRAVRERAQTKTLEIVA